MKTLKSILYKQIPQSVLLVIMGALLGALFLNIAWAAWTEPSTNPPGGNVAKPLNVGPDTQSKSGSLGVGDTLELFKADTGSREINLKNNNGFWHISGPRSYESNNPLGIWWNDGSWNGPYLYIRDNGNVGIGTNNPQAKLDVDGTGRFTGTLLMDDIGSNSAKIRLLSEAGDEAYIFSENYGSNQNRLVIETADDGDQDYIVFRNRHWNLGTKDVMNVHRNKVTIDGNVGIGTTGPLDKLDVRGDVTLREASPTITFRDTNNYTGFIHMNSNWMYFLSSAGADVGSWTVHGSYWPLRINMANDNIEVGGNLYVREGNVGIGTFPSAAKLQVAGGDLKGDKFTIDLDAGTAQKRITSQAVGGGYTIEFQTEDGAGNLATRQRINGGSDATTWYIYSGASGSESPIITVYGGSSPYLDMNNNKISNVSEIDPVFNINDTKYVTYMPDSIGQKVYAVGEDKLDGDKLEIDLASQPEGSDLWLFWQVADHDSVVPFVSAQSPASLYAYMEGSKVIVKLKDGQKDASFSLRLIGTRIDHADDTDNLYNDQSVESYIDIDHLRK